VHARGTQNSVPKKDGKKIIDDMWLYTILAMIGENFEAGQSLCGAVVRCDACCGWLARKNEKMKKCLLPAAAGGCARACLHLP
jgi:hypothetical protein